MLKLSADAQFFFDHAGYSYRPDETREQGRTRCALNLAAAEGMGRAAGLSFEWVSDTDSDEPGHYGCICHDSEGAVTASLWGIGFADDGTPWDGDPYRRVVEAELAAETIGEILETAAGV